MACRDGVATDPSAEVDRGRGRWTWPRITMYVPYIMKRTQIYLEADQDRRLSARARAAGATKSTLIREAVETYLSASDDEAAQLTAFRGALDAIAGSPADLPDGRTYVERLRQADRERDEEIEKRRR
jgi:predicted transcriptional regulator